MARSENIKSDTRPKVTVGFIGGSGTGKTLLAAQLVHASRWTTSGGSALTPSENHNMTAPPATTCIVTTEKTLKSSLDQLIQSGQTRYVQCPQTLVDLAKDTMGYSYQMRLVLGGSTVHYNEAMFPPSVTRHFYTLFDIPSLSSDCPTSEVRGALSLLDVAVLAVDPSSNGWHEAAWVSVVTSVGMGVERIIVAITHLDLIPDESILSTVQDVTEQIKKAAKIAQLDESAPPTIIRIVPVQARFEQNVVRLPTETVFIGKCRDLLPLALHDNDAEAPLAITPDGSRFMTLLETLEAVASSCSPQDGCDRNKFTLDVLRSFKLHHKATRDESGAKKDCNIVIGRVASGSVAVDDEVVVGPIQYDFFQHPSLAHLGPSKKKTGEENRIYIRCRVRSIGFHRVDLQRAETGAFIGMHLDPILPDPLNDSSVPFYTQRGRRELFYMIFSGRLTQGLLVTDPQNGGRVLVDSFSLKLRYVRDKCRSVRDDTLCDNQFQVRSRRHNLFSVANAVECIDDKTQLKPAVVPLERMIGDEVNLVSRNVRAWNQTVRSGVRQLPPWTIDTPISLIRGVGEKVLHVSRSGSICAIGIVTAVSFHWDNISILNINCALREVFPFELAHVILCFATEFAPVQLTTRV